VGLEIGESEGEEGMHSLFLFGDSFWGFPAESSFACSSVDSARIAGKSGRLAFPFVAFVPTMLAFRAFFKIILLFFFPWVREILD